MSRAQFLLRELDRVFDRRGRRALTLLEVGCIRHRDWAQSDGHSTRYIAEWVASNPPDGDAAHRFIAVDVRTSVCNLVLKEYGLRDYVELRTGDALAVLPTLNLDHIDLAYLDGPDDPDFTVSIFESVLARSDADTVFAFDDFNLADSRQVKGEKLYPALIGFGVEVAFRDRIAIFTIDEQQKELFHDGKRVHSL